MHKIKMLINKTKNLLKTSACKDFEGEEKAKREIEYTQARDNLLTIPEIQEHIPVTLFSTITLNGYRQSMTEYGSYDKRKEYINNDFIAIETFLEKTSNTIIPEGFKLSQEQISEKIHEHFKAKNSKLTNIYGEFTQTNKQLGNGGTSIVKAFELENINKQKTNYAFKFLAENIYEKEGRTFKRFKQAHLNIATIQNTGAILPQLHLDTLHIADDLIIPYVMMPIAEKTLKKLISDLKKSDKLTFENITQIFIQLCKRLESIHSKGIIHRDIKPENIFIYEGDIVIGDFDIAKFSDDLAILIETKDGERLANYNCSAPEQSSKKFDEITFSADWYAIGQILHWMITGEYKRGSSPINYKGYDSNNKFVIYEKIVTQLLSDTPEYRPNNYDAIQSLLKQKEDTRISSLHKIDKFIDFSTVGVEHSQFPFFEINKSTKMNEIIQDLITNGREYQLNYFKGSSDSIIEKFTRTEEDPLILRLWTSENHALELKVDKVIVFKSPYGTGGHIFAIATNYLRKCIFNNPGCTNEYEFYIEYQGKKFTHNNLKNGMAHINNKTIETDGTEVQIERQLEETIVFFATQHQFGTHPNFSILENAHENYNRYRDAKSNFEHLFKELKRPEWLRMID